jgi:glycosyltransferase involved in cell wall biosynthesis
MRVLHIVHQYPPEFVGGTELYTQTVARSLVARGHAVSVFAPSKHTRDPARLLVSTDEDGVRAHRVSLGPRSANAVFFATFTQRTLSAAFAAILQQDRPALIHLQHLMGLPARLIDQIGAARIPFIATLHDYWYVCANAQLLTNTRQEICAGPRWWVNCGQCALARAGHPDWLWLAPAAAPLMGYRNRLLHRVLTRAACLIAPTEFVRETYRQLGAPTDRAQVISHGIELPSVLPPVVPRSTNALRVAYIGGLAWQKGVHIAIEAVNGLPAHAVQLTIYGDIAAFPKYVAELKQLAQQSSIRFAGRLARSELWQVLRETDVVVVPSLWYETASLIVQEAFAAGVPVMASDLGALRERVRDNIDGLLVTPGDPAAWRAALQRCTDEPELLLRLRQGIRPVRSVEEHITDLETLYAEIVAVGSRQ